MNPKQFISSALFNGVDWGTSRIPFFGKIIAFPCRIVFPTMGYERFGKTPMNKGLFLSIYLAGFLVLFVLQAFLAAQAGYLGEFNLTFEATAAPNGGPPRIMFLDDAHNLFNYALIVPLYLVAGTGFMISLFSLPRNLNHPDQDHGFHLPDSVKPLVPGVVAVTAFVVLLIIIQSGYAMDVQEKSMYLFWFHGDTTTSSFSYNGYAYLITNVLLCAFVLLIALLHLELYRWSAAIVAGIKSYQPKEGDDHAFLRNVDRVKELFSPFTETAIWSKAFAMLLAINIYTWQDSGVSGGFAGTGTLSETGLDSSSLFFRLILVLYLVIVLWLVSLPRYRVQYELFKLAKRYGVHEYQDIRMPWTIGWSVFIDLILLTFFSTMIFGSNQVLDLMNSFTPG